MFKYIILCFCVTFNAVLCDLNKEEGADCEWEDLKGQCVKETRCLTTLDDASPKHPICSEKDGETIVCCTDCELVNDTKNAVFTPTGGIYWKDGRKARDNCLQYLKDLPYQCKQDGFYGGIHRELDGEKKCYKYGVWAVGGAPPKDKKPSAKYPHQVLLGYGDEVSNSTWAAGGFIISDKYIVTAAHATRNVFAFGALNFIAVGVKSRSDPTESWQIHKIKRVIAHPEYKAPSKYHDIALLESDTPIKFDKNVLPACLHVDEAADVEDTITTTWLNLEKDSARDIVDTIQTIKLEAFSEEECKAAYVPMRQLINGYDHATQMCYGSKTDKTNAYETCKGLSGEPVLVHTQFSSCVYTAIGVTSFGPPCGSTMKSDIYTRVSYYVPWIEGIVWP